MSIPIPPASTSWSRTLLIAILAMGPTWLHAQPGERVLSYGTDGELVVSVGADLTFSDAVSDPSTHTVISAFHDGSTPSDPRVHLSVAELGQASAFSLPTLSLEAQPNLPIRLAVDDQGRILVAATRNDATTWLDVHVMRLAQGAVDPSFGPAGAGGIVAAPFVSATENLGIEVLKDLQVLSDGRIALLAETAIAEPGTPHGFALIILLDDGTPDPSISQGWGDGRIHLPFSESIVAEALVEDADGRLVLLGWRSRVPSGREMVMARLLPSGALDTTFSGDGMHVLRYRPCAACAEVDDGFFPIDVEVSGPDIYVLATVQDNRSAVARITDLGSPDPAFGHWVVMPLGSFGGVPVVEAQAAWDVKADDRSGLIVLTTVRHPFEGGLRRIHVARLLTDGTPDPDFAQSGVLVTQSTAGGGFPGNARRVLTVDRTPQFVDTPTVIGPYEDASGTPYNVLRLQGVTKIFSDGFESGGTTAWQP